MSLIRQLPNIILFALLTSCSQKEVFQIRKKTIQVDLHSVGRIHHAYTTKHNRKDALVAYDIVNAKLHVVGLFKPKMHKTFNLEHLQTQNNYSCVGAEPNKPFFTSSGIDDEETIYALEYETNKLFIIGKTDTNWVETSIAYSLSPPNQGGIQAIDSQFVFTCHGPDSMGNYFSNTIATLSLLAKDSSSIASNIAYPRLIELYKSNQLLFPYLIVNDSFSIVSFKLKEFALSINHKTNMIDTIQLHNPTPPNFLDYRTMDKPLFDSWHEQEIFKKNSEEVYGPILFDEYRNLYYRICKRASSDAKENYIKDSALLQKHWNLLVYDSQFNFLTAYNFSGIFDPNSILVTSKGLLISKTNESNRSLDFTPRKLAFEFALFKVNLQKMKKDLNSKT
ncbi:MAG: DUF4221 domain-containing protein [Salibacteraceae bacterium]|nr:DUF4221 domain-containing protein [Salibacteraceae bacterium]MDP4762062.1 DUF4221 domain-containing protein [Salibacteraceae bacterium]